ncbi:GMC family oxidoreductase [Marinospirillum minutulum]|uniref:GMC family oxidoreductase n=1 Tax=Marinospirillum minutulum TaxID=64974 RepID=UPI0003F782E2|nr:GMC family oxidoreductase [Marinospirillum minutulum]
MAISDVFLEGVQAGWQVHNASLFEKDQQLEVDVVIVGSGAGGATTAEILTAAGLRVLVVEEGPLRTSSDFKMQEATAYAELYQEGMARMSKDGGISIMQGRAVGGSTLINWTSSFRTPPATLEHWADKHEVSGLSEQTLKPWFERMEKRLGIEPWPIAANANNEVIKRGCQTLGYDWAVIPRNVRDCLSLGFCGMGCPANAKQSMLVTCLPATLQQGGELLYLARAERLTFKQGRVEQLECLALDARGVETTGKRIAIKAKHYILAGGAINTPAILLRSQAPDPYKLCGKRTFLHPVNFSAAQFVDEINPFYGAPQSIYSDHFQWQEGAAGAMGYKLEVPPLHPAFAATILGGKGQVNAQRMAKLPNTHMMLALMRDGFHPASASGKVELRSDGSPVLDYQMTDFTWQAMRRAYHSMAEIQFAAGAEKVFPVHNQADYMTSLAETQRVIDGLDLAIHRARLGSAHVMGGCALSDNPKQGVTNSWGVHHQLENLSVHDGSVFPTSIGANPQLSIYAIAALFSDQLLKICV